MFMNRVHEQCPKIDSGKIPSRIGPKTGLVHQVHSPGQPARPGRTPAAPCRAPATACPARGQHPHARAACACCLPPARPASAGAVAHVPACLRAPAPALLRTPPAASPSPTPSAPMRAPAAFSAVSWPVLRHSPAAHCSNCHNTIFVLRYKLPAAKPPAIQSCNTTEPSSLQYKKLYCNIVSKPTTPILQYNPSLNQPPSSQLGCNTNLVLQYNSHNKIWQ